MAGEEKYLKKDLKDVLSEMSKAPGGNVPQPRPVTPGPILGGPKESKPGIVDPATGVRTKRDTAIELFRFFAFGEKKPSRLPEPAPDTKKVSISEEGLTPKEKAERKALKQAGKKVKQTAEKKAINQAVREGTIGGMTRAPGSKPPVHLAKNLPIAIEMAIERARRKAESDIIRAALEKAFGASGSEAPEFQEKFTPELGPETKLSREDQKYLDLLQRRIDDARLNREAALMEALAERGELTPTLDEVIAMQEAERRTLEGRQVAERTRISRQKTEKSMKNLGEKPPVFGKGMTGLAGLDVISTILTAKLMYEQMILDAQRKKQEIQANLMN